MQVPDAVRAKAQLVGAMYWLDELPAIVRDLQQRWDIRIGRTYPDATEAFVAEATTADGELAVLKVLLPRADVDLDHEVITLRLADGRGCARLLRSDESRGAMLIERLGPSLYEVGLPITQRHEILCDVAAQVWRPAAGAGLPTVAGLPTGADKGRWLIDSITTLWHQLDRPCTERAVEHAVQCAERRIAAHDDERARLVHGDVHQWNALRTRTGGWKLVDPDGLLADPEYDLGIVMREDPDELIRHGPERRARWLANRTGLDAAAIWEWGIVERVSTGLFGTAIGLQPVARSMLAAADQIAQDSPDPLSA